MQRMSEINKEMKQKAREMLETGSVCAVLGWKTGDLPYDNAPALFQTADALEDMVYNGFCGSNLSKYLIEKNKEEGKTLVFLKPCDTYSLNQLLSEHRVIREKLHITGIGCGGMLDIEKIRAKGIKGILGIIEVGANLNIKTIYGDENCPRQEVLLDKCLGCKGKEHMAYDDKIGADLSLEIVKTDRFSKVAELEGMTPDERFAFWRNELSRCIRCNACRNICPSCTCLKCVFDNTLPGIGGKANVNDFEENLYHIIRAFHVAGRCSDCGECSRACPEGIPLHLLNRKFIKDINVFYGEFQAGETAEQRSPLLAFDKEDPEPNIVTRGGEHK